VSVPRTAGSGAGYASGPGCAASRAASARPRPSRRRRHRPRSRRFTGVLRFVVFLLLIFFAVWAGVRVANASTDTSAYVGHTYTVHAGDTLWNVATRQYGSGIDIRQAVWDIEQANHLSGAMLHAGQTITLPPQGQ
jgi:nucleoid-associated protein YgaU